MSVNPTGIEYVDFTHNLVTGCYGPGGSKEKPCCCPFCFAKRLAERFFPYGFVPTFHPDRLVELYKLKPPGKKKRKPWIADAFPNNWLIFEGTMTDYFGDWVPDSWTGNLLSTVTNCSQHIFLMLTKNATNLMKWNKFYAHNLILGVSVTKQEDRDRIFYLRATDAEIKLISFEPLLGPINTKLEGLNWIIIGAQTNPSRIPKKDWVEPLIAQAREKKIPVFLKDNLCWPEKIQEFPKYRMEAMNEKLGKDS